MLYICEHIFHTKCLSELIFNNHLACPLCRKPIINYVKLSSDIEIKNYNNYIEQIFSELNEIIYQAKLTGIDIGDEYIDKYINDFHNNFSSNTENHNQQYEMENNNELDFFIEEMNRYEMENNYEEMNLYAIENDFRFYIEEMNRERELDQERINYELEFFIEEMMNQ